MADDEPGYIRQHGSFDELSVEERRKWFSLCADDAWGNGYTFMRASVDDADQPTRALFEGWTRQPQDQGPVRWQMTAAE